MIGVLGLIGAVIGVLIVATTTRYWFLEVVTGCASAGPDVVARSFAA